MLKNVVLAIIAGICFVFCLAVYFANGGPSSGSILGPVAIIINGIAFSLNILSIATKLQTESKLKEAIIKSGPAFAALDRLSHCDHCGGRLHLEDDLSSLRRADQTGCCKVKTATQKPRLNTEAFIFVNDQKFRATSDEIFVSVDNPAPNL